LPAVCVKAKEATIRDAAMTITLKQLRKAPCIDKLIIHSLDCSLYQVSVQLGDKELYVISDEGKFLRSHNKLSLQNLFTGMAVKCTVLRQQNAYDEMVGQPVRDGDNFLEVPLGNSDIGTAGNSLKL